MQIKRYARILLLYFNLTIFIFAKDDLKTSNWELYIAKYEYAFGDFPLKLDNGKSFKGVYFDILTKFETVPEGVNFEIFAESILSASDISEDMSIPFGNFPICFVYWNKKVENGFVVKVSLNYTGTIELYVPYRLIKVNNLFLFDAPKFDKSNIKTHCVEFYLKKTSEYYKNIILELSRIKSPEINKLLNEFLERIPENCKDDRERISNIIKNIQK